MQTETVKISAIKPNPNNPRIIRDEKFRALVKSLQEFPQMLELRPIVVDAEGVVLGGNMRLRALQELGVKEVPIVRAGSLTPEQQREFVIKDNVGFGEWDWNALANEWDSDDLTDWGLDIPGMDGQDVGLPTTEQKEPYLPYDKLLTIELTERQFVQVFDKIKNICEDVGASCNVS